MSDLPTKPTPSYSGFYFPDEPVKLRSAFYEFVDADGSASLAPARPGRKMYLPLILIGILIGSVGSWVLTLNWPPASFQRMNNGTVLFAILVAIFACFFVGIAFFAFRYERRRIRTHLSSPALLTINADGAVLALDDAARIDRTDLLSVRHIRGTVVNELTNNRMAFSQVLFDVGEPVSRPVHIASIGGGAYRLRKELEALADWLGVRLVHEHCSSDETPSYQTLRMHITDFQ